jgi:hypothetical protein
MLTIQIHHALEMLRSETLCRLKRKRTPPRHSQPQDIYAFMVLKVSMLTLKAALPAKTMAFLYYSRTGYVLPLL